MSSAFSLLVFVTVLLFGMVGSVGLASPVLKLRQAASPNGPDAPEAVKPIPRGVFYVHRATPGNTYNFTTALDHPLLNGNPEAVPLVTQNWNPGGAPTNVPNNREVGVFYDYAVDHWGIYNENSENLPAGAAFNVFIPSKNLTAFVHTTNASNVFYNWTTIDPTFVKLNPNSLVFATHNYSGGSQGDFHNHPLGVWYNAAQNKWTIFNQDLADMNEEVGFNVWLGSPDATAFVHTATEANTSWFMTSLDHPLINGNPDAILAVTQNWNPGGIGGTYNNKVIGVWYDELQQRWTILNQDISTMPVGASFNVLVDEAKVYLPLIMR